MTDAYRLGVLDGDGIGPEIVRATVDVVTAATRRADAVRLDWVPLPMGLAGIRDHGAAMSDATKRALGECHGWLMGPHDSAAYPPEHRWQRNPSAELRHHFDLFANIRPARTYPGLPSVAREADLVVVRENTEGFYPDRNMYAGAGEFMPTPDVALAVGVFTRRAAERIAQVACRLAMRRRRRLSIVHKANVLQLSTGLFRDTCRAVAAGYPEVQVEDYHVDAMAAHLVRRAADFDVIVTTNMFGDILSDLTGELTGSLGLAASLNAGTDRAMAQAAHGSAPDIAGRDVANPVGMLFSAVLLLRWLGERHGDAALLGLGDAVEAAVLQAWAAGIRTRDLGGDAGTAAFAQAVIDQL
jgi:3-isopropylmalate dehydrogenase